MDKIINITATRTYVYTDNGELGELFPCDITITPDITKGEMILSAEELCKRIKDAANTRSD